MPVIEAADLAPGMVIVERKRRTKVERVERGESCNGVHVNVVRRPSHIKVKGKWHPNPEAGRMVHNDGCYDRASTVVVE